MLDRIIRDNSPTLGRGHGCSLLRCRCHSICGTWAARPCWQRAGERGGGCWQGQSRYSASPCGGGWGEGGRTAERGAKLRSNSLDLSAGVRLSSMSRLSGAHKTLHTLSIHWSRPGEAHRSVTKYLSQERQLKWMKQLYLALFYRTDSLPVCRWWFSLHYLMFMQQDPEEEGGLHKHSAHQQPAQVQEGQRNVPAGRIPDTLWTAWTGKTNTSMCTLGKKQETSPLRVNWEGCFSSFHLWQPPCFLLYYIPQSHRGNNPQHITWFVIDPLALFVVH